MKRFINNIYIACVRRLVDRMFTLTYFRDSPALPLSVAIR